MLGLVVALASIQTVHAAASAYDEIIAPIFRARCVECHGEKKQKAKLALHTYDGVLRGSDAGPIVVAGKPDDSVMLQRLRLPLGDEDHMPPQDHPQPAAEEIALLARWIERGASSKTTLAELDLPAPLAKAMEQLPNKLAEIEKAQPPAEALWEFDPAAVAKLRAPLANKVAELQRRFPGALSYESRTSAALHFTAVGFGRAFGDAELARLAAVSDDLVLLDVSGTGITDASAPVLARCTKLRVLRAGFTDVGDVTAQTAAALPSLELLALSETKVTAASVGALSKQRTLRALRVAGTAAERPAQAANLPVAPSAADLLPPAPPEPEPKIPTP
jgi:hypothetical protein